MTTTRRTFLAAAAVASLPVAAAAETPDERVDRLAWELADALNTFGNGKFRAVIHPSEKERFPVAFLRETPPMSPRERLDAAISELKAAAIAFDPKISSWVIGSSGGCPVCVSAFTI